MVFGFPTPNASRKFINLATLYIDDAIGRLMNLRFSETESAFEYMVATREYLEQHGKPTAFYSDRHALFHVSKRNAHTERLTQFGRVLNDLNIELNCANSSQAKGRVKRANKTLQRDALTPKSTMPSVIDSTLVIMLFANGLV